MLWGPVAPPGTEPKVRMDLNPWQHKNFDEQMVPSEWGPSSEGSCGDFFTESLFSVGRL